MKPKGKPLELTDKQLEELSEITQNDIKKAQKAFEKYVRGKYKNLTLAPRNDNSTNN